MEELKVNTTDCSCDKLLIVAKKCGFINKGGKKHCKIINTEGQFITTIPRHNYLSKDTVRGILRQFNKFGAKIIIYWLHFRECQFTCLWQAKNPEICLSGFLFWWELETPVYKHKKTARKYFCGIVLKFKQKRPLAEPLSFRFIGYF